MKFYCLLLVAVVASLISSSSSCSYADKHTNCPNWKDPHCTSGRYVSWMMTNCAKTCKCCTPAPNRYSSRYCSRYDWACTVSRYPWFKERRCATTCKYCDPIYHVSGISTKQVTAKIGSTIWTDRSYFITEMHKELVGSTLFQPTVYVAKSTIQISSNQRARIYVGVYESRDGGLMKELSKLGWKLENGWFVEWNRGTGERLHKIWSIQIEDGQSTTFTTTKDRMTFAIFVSEVDKCDPSSNPTSNQNIETSSPFSGTVHDLPNISPTSELEHQMETKFKSLSFIGQEQRTMYDRRAEIEGDPNSGWIQVEAFIFKSVFSDNMGVPLEIRVNPEFDTEAKAKEQALRYSQILGQSPLEFRARLEILDLNKGTYWEDGGGGGGSHIRKSLNLNTGHGEDMIEKKTIHNFFIHELCHVTFNYLHTDRGEWICAQNNDGKFISKYARDSPTTEDIAESLTAWYLIKFHPDSVSTENIKKIRGTIPHRLHYFDKYIQCRVC